MLEMNDKRNETKRPEVNEGKTMVKIPFDLRLARRIMDKEIDGVILASTQENEVELVYYNGDGTYPILGVVHHSWGLKPDWFSINGHSRANYSLSLKIPDYMVLKDGDVLVHKGSSRMFILDVHGKYLTSFHASLGEDGVLNLDGGNADGDLIGGYRLATDMERQRFVDALNASGSDLAFAHLRRFFGIDPKKRYDLKPFDRVLVKDDDDVSWEVSLFVRELQDGRYECLHGMTWDRCVPFEGNQHLLEDVCDEGDEE